MLQKWTNLQRHLAVSRSDGKTSSAVVGCLRTLGDLRAALLLDDVQCLTLKLRLSRPGQCVSMQMHIVSVSVDICLPVLGLSDASEQCFPMNFH